MDLLVRRGLLRVGPHRPLPSLFCLPGLSQQPVWKLEHLPPATQAHISELCAHVPTLLAEHDALAAAAPKGDYADEGEHKLHQGSWTWHSFVQRGNLVADFALRAPRAASLLGSLPGLITGGVPFSYAFFSSLSAGARIAPHFGPTNTRLRMHLPLRVPQGDLGLVVAGETLRWEVGVPLIFDDSYEHSAYNATAGDRLVLLADIWTPQMHPEEQQMVVDMFARARKEGWLK